MFKKRLLAFFLVLSIVFTAIPTNVIAQEDPQYLTRGIAYILIKSGADGYSSDLDEALKTYESDTYDDSPVARIDYYKLVGRVFGKLPEPVGNNLRLSPDDFTFSNVPSSVAEEVNNLLKGKVILPSADGKFNGSEYITIEEAVNIVKRIWALKGTDLRDDFYSTVNKEWLDNSVIKPGESAAGGFYEVSDFTNERLTEIIKEVSSKTYKKGTKKQKISDFYNVVSDMDSRNEAGAEPLKPYLDTIDQSKNIKELYEAKIKIFNELSSDSIFSIRIGGDVKNPLKNSLYFYSISPMLDKEFYEKEDPVKTKAYKNYLTTLLTLSGEKKAAEKVNNFYDMEKIISKSSTSNDDWYVTYTPEEFKKLFPPVEISKIITDFGYKTPKNFVVYNNKQTKAFAKYYNSKNLELLKTTVKLHLINQFSHILSQDFLTATIEFNNIFYGIEGTKTTEELASSIVQNVMSDYLGELFVQKHFSAKEKKEVENMVKDFITIFKLRIKNLKWMSVSTRYKAIEKLDNMTVKVGYPNAWDSIIDNVEIKGAKDGGTYFSNAVEISNADRKKNIALQGKAVDRTKWHTPVFTVNAYYDMSSNEIVLPAGILQAPFYDSKAPMEANLGGIGNIIAHEITHAFDINGSAYDKDGKPANWWTKQDRDNFFELCADVYFHYDREEFAPGFYTDGYNTLGENIADLGGMACALDAMKKLYKPDYDLFFKSYTKIYRFTCTKQQLEMMSKSDEHSFAKVRVNSLIQNFDEFYTTYDVKPTDGMYTSKRIRVW